MASASAHGLLLISSCLISLLSFSSATPHAHALVLPVKKDQTTRYYVTRITSRTPLVPLNLAVDLGGRYLWVDCDAKYISSTYRPVHCNTPQCALVVTPYGCGDCFLPHRPGCNNRTCSAPIDSPTVGSDGELGQDVFSFTSTDGSGSGPTVSASDFIFACAPSFMLKDLPRGVSGMAGLGRNRVGMPFQLAVDFRLRPKFAICLPSSQSSNGAVFFGDGPYKFLPNVDASQSLIYTPLLVNRVSTAGSYVQGEKSVEYFVGVKSIRVNDKAVPLNTTLLAIDKHGIGGTKISTVDHYTTAERSIYRAVTNAFASAMGRIRRVAPVRPFELCYQAADIGSTRVGPAVPAIDLVLQNETVYWRMFGANSMVEAEKGVLCLAFVEDSRVNPTTSIVIGGYQLENNLLQFDLRKQVLGFSSSLLFRQTTCANFNFNFTAKSRGDFE